MTVIYLAIPTHSNTITVDTAVALLDFQNYLPQIGIQLRTVFHSSSLITHLRNTIVANFLAEEATHLLMLDSDQHIPATLVESMIASNHPVVGVIYPKRSFAKHQIRPASGPADPDTMFKQAMHFVGEIKPSDTGDIEIVNGFARANHIGAGAMLIKREAILKLIDHYPELHGTGFPAEAEYAHLAPHNWGFFNLLTKQHDTHNAGEDSAFCQRWLRIGGEMWADVVTDTTHVGRYGFKGNYLSYLESFMPPDSR